MDVRTYHIVFRALRHVHNLDGDDLAAEGEAPGPANDGGGAIPDRLEQLVVLGPTGELVPLPRPRLWTLPASTPSPWRSIDRSSPPPRHTTNYPSYASRSAMDDRPRSLSIPISLSRGQTAEIDLNRWMDRSQEGGFSRKCLPSAVRPEIKNRTSQSKITSV